MLWNKIFVKLIFLSGPLHTQAVVDVQGLRNTYYHIIYHIIYIL